MKKLIMLAMLMGLLLSGCAVPLNKNFEQDAKKDLGIEPIVYHQAHWIVGVYGYQNTKFLIGSTHTIIRGALVCGQDEIYFVVEDKTIQKYVPAFKFKYSEITQVSISRFGASRRLVIFAGNDIKTLEIASGITIDKGQTLTICIFILDKIGKKDEADLYRKQLEGEKRKEEATYKYRTQPLAESKSLSGSTTRELFVTLDGYTGPYYHRMDCEQALSIAPTARRKLSKEQAEAKGLKPCPICKPLEREQVVEPKKEIVAPETEPSSVFGSGRQNSKSWPNTTFSTGSLNAPPWIEKKDEADTYRKQLEGEKSKDATVIDKRAKVYVGIYSGSVSNTVNPAYRYFHKKDCKHLWGVSTEKMTVGEAIARGKSMCPDCFRD
jgi:hypothetical protein